MFKSIATLSAIICCSNLFGQVNSGIEIAKKSQLNENQKNILADTVMSDKFVPTKPAFYIDKPLEDQLISLDSLIKVAQSLNPSIRAQFGVIEREQANHAHEKTLWTKNIYGSGFYFQGSTNALITSTFDANASSSLSNGARYGLTVQVPLYEFVGRKRKNKIAKLNYEAEELKLDQTNREIATEVIQMYSRLISSQKLFFIAADGLQSSSLNEQNAQNEFESGLITLAELSRIREIHLRIRTDYEVARAEFFNSFYLFEIIVGKKIEELVKNN